MSKIFKIGQIVRSTIETSLLSKNTPCKIINVYLNHITVRYISKNGTQEELSYNLDWFVPIINDPDLKCRKSRCLKL